MQAFRYNSENRSDRKYNNCGKEKNPNAVKFYASNMDYANNYKFIYNEDGEVVAECSLQVVEIENVNLFDMANDFKSLATYNNYIASEIGAQMRDYTRFMNNAKKATDVYTVLPTGTGNLLELFAGSRSVGKVGERLGYNVFSIDWKEYEGIDLAIDIGNLTKEDVPFIPDVVWASPDCTTYSIAACSTHRTNSIEPKTEYAKKCDQVNKHFIGLIKEWLKVNPDMVFFIENPRGMLRKMPFMQEFKRHTIWYCQYGDDRAKPTDIWTNSNDWIPRPQCKNGNPNCHHQRAPRGSKTGTQGRKGSYERSIIPRELCLEVLSSACG